MTTAFMGLLDERGTLKEEAQGLIERAHTEGRDFTAEEQTRFNEIEAGMVRLNARIERETRLRELVRNTPAAAADPLEAGWDHQDPEPETYQLPSAKLPSARDYKGPRPFRSFGEQLIAIRAAAVQGATPDPRLLQVQAAAQGASSVSDVDGGYLIQQDFVNEIERRIFQGGAILSRVRRIPISGNGLKLNMIDETSRVDGSRAGGVRAYWAEEASSVTATRPKFRRFELNLNKVMALYYATEELFVDAPALESEIVNEFANEVQFKVEDAVFEGDGQGKPLGFTNSANASLISQAKETNQNPATVVANNVIKMRSRLHVRGRANSVWFVNNDVEPQLPLMTIAVGTGGMPVYLPANGLADDGLDRLYGRPVVPVEYASTVGTVGDIVLADLSQYMFGDKGGMRQAWSMHVAFTTEENAFRVSYRCDGASKWSSALTPFKGTTTVSPFVALATRS